MTFTWHVVTKNLQGHELLGKKLREKVAKLERHLMHFPQDAVHLQIALEKQPKKEQYTAALTLRVPSNTLRSRQTAADIIKAFDDAIRALLRELESLKSSLRHEHLRPGRSAPRAGKFQIGQRSLHAPQGISA